MNKALSYALIFIQLLDILLHSLTNQFEMIRVISNCIVIGWVLILSVSINKAVLKLFTTVSFSIYIILNGLFVFENGIVNPITQTVRLPLLVFVLMTVLLMIILIIKEIYGSKRM